MFIIRRAKLDDLSVLMKLAKMVHFINLPADRQIIADKIARARRGFLRASEMAAKAEPGKPIAKRFKANSKNARSGDVSGFDIDVLLKNQVHGFGESNAASDVFFFILEDTDNPGCLGTSQMVSEMGGPENPNVCFRLERRDFYSPGLKTGTSQDVARLYFDETSPTELGGLILQPSFRGHPAKLGRFLAMIRFHVIGLYPTLFSDTMLAEMMAPLGHDGTSLFWDHVGRRFIPLSYDEADRLCQYSREFMISLMPKGDIYLSLLPPAPRTEVGQVGLETRPARRMLESLGFEYKGFVDPFDAGPYLHAKTADIELVRASCWAELGPAVPKAKLTERGFISRLPVDGDFVGINEPHHIDSKGRLCLSATVLDTLGWSPGMVVGYTPTPARTKDSTAVATETSARKTGARKTVAKNAVTNSTKQTAPMTAHKPSTRRTKSTA